MDIEDQIPPPLPLQKGGIPPLWPPAHRASGPEGKEGSGEIFTTICLFNYGLLCNICKGYSKIPTRLIYPSNLASTDKQYQFWYQLFPCNLVSICSLLNTIFRIEINKSVGKLFLF